MPAYCGNLSFLIFPSPVISPAYFGTMKWITFWKGIHIYMPLPVLTRQPMFLGLKPKSCYISWEVRYFYESESNIKADLGRLGSLEFMNCLYTELHLF